MKAKSGFALGALTGLLLGGTAVVVASIPNSNTGIISACLKASGAVQIIDTQAGKKCQAGETLLSWNQVGPVGAPGPAGPEGPAGPAGSGVSLSNLLAPYAWDSNGGILDGLNNSLLVTGVPYTLDWRPARWRSVGLSEMYGWQIDSAQLPNGTGMRISALLNLNLIVQNDSTVPVRFCVRLADEGGPILGSEMCLDETATPGWSNPTQFGYGISDTYTETRVVGPTVPVRGTRQHLEIMEVATPYTIASPWGGNFTTVASGGIIQPYVEIVSPG